jgi:hypothetical protein
MGLRNAQDTRRDLIGSPWSNAPWVVIVTAGLAAVFLLAVLCAEVLAGKRWARTYGGPGPEELARLQLQNFAASAELYGLERRRVLPRLDDLTRSDMVAGMPYIKRIPPDPWSRPYVYRVLGPQPSAFEIRSLGADGRPDTQDDLVERGADYP